ncbi:MAG: hypothetical protein AAGG75_20405 [Bacteroidota bacterium]
MQSAKKQLFVLLLLLSGLTAFGQVDLGIEFQAYPTGLMPGVRAEFGLDDKQAVHIRLGYNIVRHRDLGEHDDERGGGFGGSLGYRRYFGAERSGWFAGVRGDVWFNDVDWKDNIGEVDEVRGNTDVVVVQPTAEAGYRFGFGERWFFAPSIALGAEINIKTEGADVGQGAVLLLGFSIGKRIGG